MPSPLLVPAALLNLLVLVVALVASRRQFAVLLPRGYRERDALLLVLILAFAVRAANPFHPIPWMSEGFFTDQAEGMLIYRLNGFCSTGEMIEGRLPFSLFLPLDERSICQQYAVFYPSGYPFVLAIFSSLLGIGTTVPRVLGVLGGTLTVALTYLLARALSRDDRVALSAALVLALLPMHVRFSVKALSEVSSVLLEVLAVLAAVVHVRSQRPALGWLAASALGFHIAVRRENPVAALPVLLIYLWGRRKGFKPSVLPWLVALALLVPYAMEWQELTFGYMDISRRMSPTYVLHNLNYVSYWLDGYFQPFLFTALAVLGVAARYRTPSPFVALAALWFVARMTPYLFHEPFTTATPVIHRYMINAMVPYALLAGAGSRALCRSRGHLIAVLVLSGLAHLPFAYGPLFGGELGESTRATLRTVHLALPVLVLGWAAMFGGARYPRQLGALAVLGLVLVTVLYPLADPVDDLSAPIRDAIELETRTASDWRSLVSDGCYVVAAQPMRSRTLWGRHPLVPGSDPGLSGIEDTMDGDVRTLLGRGECVYLYDTSQGTAKTSLVMRQDFALEPLARVPVPPVLAKAVGDVHEHTLYRVSPPRG